MVYDKRLVSDYLIRKNEEIEQLKFVERELKIDMIPNKAISIIGPRRAGKSYFLKIIGREFANPFYVDFENTEVKYVEPNEVFEIVALHSEIFGSEAEILLLDEIQNLKDWSSVVRSLLDRGFKVVISGSSSKLLSKEIATQLRGRTISYLLLPFSFREFLKLKKIFPEKYITLTKEAKIRRALREYLTQGGYPEIVLSESDERKARILKEYYHTILYLDFVERFELKSIEVARLIFDFFLQNYSNFFSVNKIANFLSSQGVKHGKSTVYEYVEKLPETFAVFFVERISKSVYERKSWPKKAYICDLGLGNVVNPSENFGARMENSVFLELLRESNKTAVREIFLFKNKEGNEVDFVIREASRIKKLVQVTYANSRDEIEHREVKSLIKASDVLRCKDLLCITWDYEGEEKIGNRKIKFLPLWRWLIQPDS